MGAEDVNTPAKILDILEQNWEEHRDASTLAVAFFRRQQGLTESIGEYAASLRLLWAKTNAARADTLSDTMLRDTVASGLHPTSLKRAIERYIKENAGSTFTDVKKRSPPPSRWMREDSCPQTTIEQLVPNHEAFSGWKRRLPHSPQRRPASSSSSSSRRPWFTIRQWDYKPWPT